MELLVAIQHLPEMAAYIFEGIGLVMLAVVALLSRS